MIYGPHCSHADLCSWFGCDQRGHIDYPCREESTCPHCGPGAICPRQFELLAVDCPECHVGPATPTVTVESGAEFWTAPAGTPPPADLDDPAASGYTPVHVTGDGIVATTFHLAPSTDGQSAVTGRIARVVERDQHGRITSVTQDRAPITFTAIDTSPDIVATITAAIGCQQCGRSLGGSPSDDFCGEACQERWHAARVRSSSPAVQWGNVAVRSNASVDDAVAAIVGHDAYRQRYALGVTPGGDVVGVRPDGSVGEVDHVVTVAAGVDDSPVARMLELRRREDLEAREENREVTGRCWGFSTGTGDSFAIEPATRLFDDAMRAEIVRMEVEWARAARVLQPALTHLAESFAGFAAGVREALRPLEQLAQALDDSPPADPKARALWLKQRRNTGPARQQRAPRAITARGSR